MDTVTSLTLLEAIKDSEDYQAWNRFVSRYTPMITSFAKRFCLDASDVDDVGQETLLSFLRNYRQGQYDQNKGKLRSWLFGIAHHKVIDIQRRKNREIVIPDERSSTGFFAKIESSDEMAKVWDEEWQRSILRACMEEVAKEMNPQTLSAFEFYVIRQWPVEAVTRHLEISSNTVYIAKNRVLNRIRKVKREMEEVW
jgi:RNA polymerase sigma-70 factor, ECF subfamily